MAGNAAPLVIWYVLEATITIIAACLIVMRPLYVQLFDRRLVRYPGRNRFTPNDNTDGTLIESAGGVFRNIQNGSSTIAQVESERRWPGVGRQRHDAETDSDLEALEVQDQAVQVKTSLDVSRG